MAKTYEELRAQAAKNEMDHVTRQYAEARQNLDYVSVHGTDKEFNDAFLLTEMIRNNLNWLRKVRAKDATV